MRKIASLSAMMAAFGLAGAAHADSVIYDSTNNPRFNQPSDTTPLRYNDNSPFFSTQPGVPDRPTGDTTRIEYDDVPVFTGGLVNPNVNVTSVQFDIVQIAGAPSVNVSGFWSPMVVDTATPGGPGDGPNDDPATAFSLGAPINIAANTTGNNRVVSITFNTPFNTGILNDTEAPGDPRQFFNVGLSFDNTSALNGWEVADNVNNLDLLWDWKSVTDINEFTFGNDANGDPVFGVQAMKVTGNLVPEPSMIGLMIGGAGMLLRRRGRKA